MFNLPEEMITAASGTLSNQNEDVNLGFPFVRMYHYNGDIALEGVEEIKDPRRFGGWNITVEEIEQKKNLIPAELPSMWKLIKDLKNKTNGESYDAYLSRGVYFAPISRRFRWPEGKKSEVEYLGYLADMKEKKLLPWGYVILKASSTVGNDLTKCFDAFSKATSVLRGKTPINYFFIPIGTWQDKPIFDMRGKAGNQHGVTPQQLGIPKDGYTTENIAPYFVGNDLAKELYTTMSLPVITEWKASWKAAKKNDSKTTLPEPNPFDPS